MKTTRLPLLLAGFLSLSSLLHAQTITSGVPGFISYQGRVLDSAGAPVGTGTPVNRTVTFRVWDHPSNTLEANLIYSEQQTVTIADGKFSVLVGQGVATTGTQFSYSETSKGPPASIANAFNGSGRYLGVTVDDGTVAVDNEIAPRQQVVTSAFAFRSKFAETLGTNNITALTVLDSGNIGVGNTSPTGRFTVTAPVTSTTTINPQFLLTDSVDPNESLRIGVDSTGSAGSGSGFLQSWKQGTGATNLLLNPNGGNVGIGTSTPLGRLHVVDTHVDIFTSTGLSGGFAKDGLTVSSSPGAGFSSMVINSNHSSVTDRGILDIKRQGSSKFYVRTDGNVGIGTTTPNGALDVEGYVRIQTGADNKGLLAFGNRGSVNYYDNGVYRGAVGSLANGNYLNLGSYAGIAFNTSAAALGSQPTRMFIDGSSGNVTIGTTAPLYPAKLLVHNVNAPTDSVIFYAPGVGTIASHIHNGPNGDVYWRSASSVGKVILQDTGGNVGIGTQVTTVAKLVVSGTGGSENLGSHYTYGNTGVIAAPGSYPGIGGISIKASDAVHASLFRALSDARIKVIEGVSDGVADLGTLNRIEITNYTYKDVIGKGKDRSKKVIAQQVEKVFPQAVSKSVDVVPDIYQKASIAKGWIEVVTDLKKGERVRLINDLHDGIHEVLEVKKDRFLTTYRPDLKSDSLTSGVTTAMTPPTSTPKDSDKTDAAAKADGKAAKPSAGVGQVFVFGREVNDFRAVDYEAISMLNVSATQELARKLAASEAAVKALQKENATLREQEEINANRLAEMSATDKAFEAKLTALEKRLSAGKSDLKTVSTQ